MSVQEAEYVYIYYLANLAKRKGYPSSPDCVLNLYYCPLVCEWFAFGLVFQDFGEFLQTKFKLFLGIVVYASPVQVSN